MKNITLVFLLLLVFGCSTLGIDEARDTIHIKNAATIKYTGKGAGASFALMGAMGPIGAAIGVAIDEGISKDIRKNIEVSGFDLVAHLCEQYRKQEVHCVSVAEQAQQTLVIEKIDLTSKGSDDLMQIKVEAIAKSYDGNESLWVYNSGETAVSLGEAKSNLISVRSLLDGVFLTKMDDMK